MSSLPRLTFRELTGNQVALDLFTPPARMEVQHVALAERADAIAVVPATANTIAKFAQGLADNLLTSVVLATRKPVLVAPAMNVGMYENPATQTNLALLRTRGFNVIGPAEGRLLSGSVGLGRLAPLEEILSALERLVCPSDYAGERVVVTAGGTREAIDPVRFMGNRSSGRMGVALAHVFASRGAAVTLVAGALEVPPPSGVEVLRVESTSEMRAAVLACLPKASMIVMAGAPADFRPDTESPAQNKTANVRPRSSLALMPTEDIAAEVGRNKGPEQFWWRLLPRRRTCWPTPGQTGAKARTCRGERYHRGRQRLRRGDQPGLSADVRGEQSLPLLPKGEVAWAVADALRPFAGGRGLNG